MMTCHDIGRDVSRVAEEFKNLVLCGKDEPLRTQRDVSST